MNADLLKPVPQPFFNHTHDPEPRQCSCGHAVTHRAVSMESSLFAVPLWRPVRHCAKCGCEKFPQESSPGTAEFHVQGCIACLRHKQGGGTDAAS